MNLKLDSTHDLIIGRGTARVSGIQLVAQNITCRLQTLFGEWQLDENLGVPWLNYLEKGVDIRPLKSILSGVIASTNGVTQVTYLDVKSDTTKRLIYVAFNATTIYGNIEQEVEYGGN